MQLNKTKHLWHIAVSISASVESTTAKMGRLMSIILMLVCTVSLMNLTYSLDISRSNKLKSMIIKKRQSLDKLSTDESHLSTENPDAQLLTLNAYQDMTVPELKSLLRSRGLMVSGIKSALIERLQSEERLKNAEFHAEEENTSAVDISPIASRLDAVQVTSPRRSSLIAASSNEYENEPIVLRESRDPYIKSSSKASVVYKKGDAVEIRVKWYGRLGASVEIMNDEGRTGMIIGQEIEFWKKSTGAAPNIDETIPAFVQNV